MPKEPVSVYLDEEEVVTLEKEARERGRTVSGLIRFLIWQWIRERKEEADEKR